MSKFQKLLLVLAGIGALFVMASMAVADAPNFWLLSGNKVKPINNTWDLQVSSTAGESANSVNGVIHYDSNANVFRCYQNSTWQNCIGTGTSTSTSTLATTTVQSMFQGGSYNIWTSGFINASSSRFTSATTTNLGILSILGKSLATDPNGVVMATTSYYGTVTGVTGSNNITSSGGTTPNLTLNSNIVGLTVIAGTTHNATSTNTNNLTLLGVASGTQCLHANSSGVVSGTGSDCGAGGGGTASGTAGSIQFSNGSGGFNANNNFSYDNTSNNISLVNSTWSSNLGTTNGIDAYLDLFNSANNHDIYLSSDQDSYFSTPYNVGIGTDTPTATLFVQGKGGVKPFVVASSTGTALVTVLGSGNVGIGVSNPQGPLVISGSATHGAEWTTLNLVESTNTNKKLRIGYDVSSDYAFLQAAESGVDNKPLVLNPNGGTVGVNGLFSTISGGGYTVGLALNTDLQAANLRLGAGQSNMAISPENGSKDLTIYSTFTNGVGFVNPRLTILSSTGYVGIGTITPSQLLTVGTNNQFTVSSAGDVTSGAISSGAINANGNTVTVGANLVLGNGYINWGANPNNLFQVPNNNIVSNSLGYVWVTGHTWSSDSQSSGTDGLWNFTPTYTAITTATSTGTFQLVGINIAPNFGQGNSLVYNSTLPMVGLSIRPTTNINTNSTGTYAGLLVNAIETQVGANTTNYLALFQTNTSTKVSITSAGKVGIGTTSPTQLLTIGNNNQFTFNPSTLTMNLAGSDVTSSITTGGQLNITTGGNGQYLSFTNANGLTAGTQGGSTYFNTGYGTTTAAGGAWEVDTGAGGATGAGGPINLFGGPGGSTSGKGGIITVSAGNGSGGNANGGDIIFSPGTKNGSGLNGILQFRLNNSASIGANMDTSLITSTSKVFTFPNATGNFVLASTSAAGVWQDLTNNYFSIGSSTPTAKLVVQGTAGGTVPLLSITSSTNASVFQVSANGNVGVGTSTPAYKFVNTGTMQLTGLTTSAGLQTAVVCLNAANEVISDSVACLASSKRFKKDIKPLNTGLDEVMQLNPVSFLYKPSFNGALQSNPNYNGQQVGFVAEEVQQIDPRLVTLETAGKDKGKPHSVRYENMVALVVQAIKDVEGQVTKVIFRVNALEAQNQNLQKELDDLKIVQAHQQLQINALLRTSAKGK